MNFIGTSYIQDPLLCTDLIAYFHSQPQRQGGYWVNDQRYVDPQHKDCQEVTVNFEHSIWHRYNQELQLAANNYVAEYPWCNRYDPWAVCESVQIQQYQPGQAFHSFHCERTGHRGTQAHRHLVFMTYLNTVLDQGGTEFPQQNLTVSAHCGSTLIWPADWTHTHRGLVAPTEVKYIITGWFSYC